MTRHGQGGRGKRTRAYIAWKGMRQRCLNKNRDTYDRYGGRGISFFQRWESFENFYTDMGDCPEGMSLERKDNDEGYSPANCEWATQETQMRNNSRTKKFLVGGLILCVKDHARYRGLPYTTVLHRLDRGWSIAAALELGVSQ